MNNDIVIRLRKTKDPLSIEAAKEIVKLRKLLEQTADELPNYTDNRYDKLNNRIDKALQRHDYANNTRQ